MNINEKKINTAIIIIAFVLLIFYEFAKDFIEYYKYIDEIFCLFIIVRMFYTIAITKKSKIDKNDLIIIILIFIFVSLGVIGNFFYKLQESQYVIIDIFSCTRIFLLFVGLHYVDYDMEQCKRHMEAIIKAFTIFIFIFAIVNLFFNIGMQYDQRFELNSYMFIYNNPGTLVIVILCFIGILQLDGKKNINYIIMLNISMILTLRALGIAMVGAYIILNYFMCNGKKMSGKAIMFLIAVIFILGIKEISYYFMNPNTARSQLVQKSILIANDHFPFGTGFGTYGSDVTRKSYSQLYHDYLIDKVYGLSENKTSFITDNYWPMIIAQFGFIGLLIILGVFYNIYKYIQKRVNMKNKISIYYILIYIIISSTAAQLLAHPYGVLVFLVLDFIVKYKEEYNYGEMSKYVEEEWNMIYKIKHKVEVLINRMKDNKLKNKKMEE